LASAAIRGILMSGNETVRIGSRGSDLALWQAHWVQRALTDRHPHLAVTIEVIRTTGDRILEAPLASIGDKGLFTREIEHALLERRIDLAVHSLKDLPTHLPEGCQLGAVTVREDVRDVFIPHPKSAVRTLRAQPAGAVIATGSLRRRCQLLHARPDLSIADIRGNLNTRMRKLEDSAWAGMILARAGVVRLGWERVIGETLETEVILPAVGQGALGIEIRSDDSRIAEIVSALDHQPTRRSTTAERALLRRLEGGCQVPIGAYGRLVSAGGEVHLRLDAIIGSLDGRRVVRGSMEGDPAAAGELGEKLAETLLAAGANRILEEIRTSGEAER
jgi:hydroxymethylbilane synthase